MHKLKPNELAGKPSGKTTGLDLHNEDLFSLLIESVSDYAIFMLDINGNIITWNKGAENIKGYKAEEIIGQHFSVFYPPEAVESKYPQFELSKARIDGRFEDEGWRVCKDGSKIWANVIITALFNKKGVHLGYSKITRDLSERRKNEELMYKNKELLRINTDLDNFIYTASHDLKTPVVNLEGLVDVLKEEMGPSAHADIMKRVDTSISRLKTVIDDLAEIAKLQDESVKAESVPLEPLVKEVLDVLKENITDAKATVKTDIGDYVFTRYARKNLRSILFNLVSNALKYASPDRAPIVEIKAEQVNENLLKLSVSDNGLGLNASQKKKIFNMYKRIHTHVEGSGLGLYMVRKILQNNQDRIEVESEEGEGTTFNLFFKI